jgi:hypothetical protein
LFAKDIAGSECFFNSFDHGAAGLVVGNIDGHGQRFGAVNFCWFWRLWPPAFPQYFMRGWLPQFFSF